MIADDPLDCMTCGATAEWRECSVCHAQALILDCGCLPQPRPIAAGRADGTALHRAFCSACAQGAISDAR